MNGGSSDASGIAKIKPVLKVALTRRILETSVDSGLKLNNDAATLSRELVHTFITEACNRAATQHRLEGGIGQVTEDHLFKVLPQLMLDF